MVLEVIYIVRHGYRSNWTIDPFTGEYKSHIISPTGIPSDPALTSYGVMQSQELAVHLRGLDIDRVYSSPYYRCLQTITPYVLSTSRGAHLAVDTGLGEFYGKAAFDHPQPAPLHVLKTHFPHIDAQIHDIVPNIKGETIQELHGRVARCLEGIIRRLDDDPRCPRSVLICTHAAVMIVAGRALTGKMPDDIQQEDFGAATCALSKFARKSMGEGQGSLRSQRIGDCFDWRDRGIAGGWACEMNGDCSFLSGGQERPWLADNYI
ncbi:phosphoglycerate mutase-like protein [Piedraia hortae CBS 480.64]|uniref:Phosphoglycerate mutase-like protein n=1 Tax=Piedraia hortae CBS 480.64 TaxID=1314780 RepID=A0A6A7BVC6_9PEZI|nr:phosphoglycerate mutase-like protein [Piedraia hortae CBS 480.64]